MSLDADLVSTDGLSILGPSGTQGLLTLLLSVTLLSHGDRTTDVG